MANKNKTPYNPVQRHKHQDSSGRPSNTRGRAPHKGGYHAAKEKGGKRRQWFEVFSPKLQIWVRR